SCSGWCLFFFSSRRRHTISKRDWSSDVCSSDLGVDHVLLPVDDELPPVFAHESDISGAQFAVRDLLGGGLRIVVVLAYDLRAGRSEERRVGKEYRFMLSALTTKTKRSICSDVAS